MRPFRVRLFIALVLLVPAAALSEILAFSFTDPVGDSTSDIEVIGLSVMFDDTTGAYEMMVIASEENPFLGAFRINVNLFNPDAGSTACSQSLLSDAGAGNGFDLAQPARRIALVGEASSLLYWAPGQRVATNDAPFGTPDCSGGFFSSVTDLPWGSPFPGDAIADGDVFTEIYAPLIFADGFEAADTSAWSSTSDP
jgi:hypothetical protein